MKGMIFNIQRFSVNDGPGIRTTIFLKGCLLHCAWCHNPESISPKKEIALRADRCIRCGDCYTRCPNHAIIQNNGSYITIRESCLVCGTCLEVCVAEARDIVGREMTTEEVMQEILRDVVFYNQSDGGVTFSGGEPLLQYEFLLSLLEACKQKDIHTAVDTSGFTSASILERIALYTDLFLYDLKTMNDARHLKFIGVSNRCILENLRLLAGWNKQIIIRVPIIPDVNDDDESLHAIGSFVNSLRIVKQIHLLPFHQSGIEKYTRLSKEYTMASVTPQSRDTLSAMEEIFRHYVSIVAVGG